MLKKRVLSSIILFGLLIALVPTVFAANPTWRGWEEWEYIGEDKAGNEYIYPYISYTIVEVKM
jgi:hypothetical protein